MLLGVIADTHDNVDAVEQSAAQFRARGINTLVHCGDIVAPPTVPGLDGFEVHAVLGNNDGEIAGLMAAFDDLGNDSTLHGRFGIQEFDGATVAFTHGESREIIRSMAASGRFDIVCFGHHHDPVATDVDGTLLCNPGALYTAVPIEDRSVAVIDTDTGDIDFVAVV